jgi:hypothetical protein
MPDFLLPSIVIGVCFGLLGEIFTRDFHEFMVVNLTRFGKPFAACGIAK